MTQQNIAYNWNIMNVSTLAHRAFARRASTEFTYTQRND